MAKIHVSVKPVSATAQKIQVQSYNGEASAEFAQAYKLATRHFEQNQNCDSASPRNK